MLSLWIWLEWRFGFNSCKQGRQSKGQLIFGDSPGQEASYMGLKTVSVESHLAKEAFGTLEQESFLVGLLQPANWNQKIDTKSMSLLRQPTRNFKCSFLLFKNKTHESSLLLKSSSFLWEIVPLSMSLRRSHLTQVNVFGLYRNSRRSHM